MRLSSDQLRQKYLEFFQGQQHLVVPSSSLIPAGDATLLLTTAGMVPIKPYFTGELTPPSVRLTSCQKCFRATDIDSVGDSSHLTFFEMLGNFSIGDYFKPEIIPWAWELLTVHLGLPAERLWVTVYLDDDEAFECWRDLGMAEDRILRFGEKDNFWGPAGSEGPCGPCSEIHYDYGLEFGCGKPTCAPNCDCQRFVELWNLVFMELYQDANGHRTVLPTPNIDTGMGLERMAAVLQGKTTVYETDLFLPLIRKVESLCGKTYGEDESADYAIRVVAEHARSMSFLIADGVVPGNEGRGYVLRRVIRRAIRFGRRLGLEGSFLGVVADVGIDLMGSMYRELLTGREFILRIIQLEEDKFQQMVSSGLPLLEKTLIPLRRRLGQILEEVITHDTEVGPISLDERKTIGEFLTELEKTLGDVGRIGDIVKRTCEDFRKIVWKVDSHAVLREHATDLSGHETFVLYDTYGFPPELTQEIAQENGLGIDMDGFQLEMDAQRRRARAVHRFGGDQSGLKIYEDLGVSAIRFIGYDLFSVNSVVVALLRDGTPVSTISKGQEADVMLRETPFYAEMGGQTGDSGYIIAPTGVVRIEDTQSPLSGLIVHRGMLDEGTIGVGDTVEAHVDILRRMDISRNHTATHLLHAALRQVLGTHVRQAGSLVAPEKLRFDFTHLSPLSHDELFQVQRLVNEKCRDSVAVQKRETNSREALAQGALAFFGDKYGDQVRVIEVSNGSIFSLEVCGGTHLDNTGQVGHFQIVSQTSIGAGLRRIEAVTGRTAEISLWENALILEKLSRQFQVSIDDLEAKAKSLVLELEAAQRELARLQREASRHSAAALLEKVEWLGSLKMISAAAPASNVDDLRDMGDWIRSKLGSGIVILGVVLSGRPTMVAMVTPDLVARGFHAGRIAQALAEVLEGGGGGRPDVAQAGGRRPDKLDAALRMAIDVVKHQEKNL
jgi:alanyl-tRNA synthetase